MNNYNYFVHFVQLLTRQQQIFVVQEFFSRYLRRIRLAACYEKLFLNLSSNFSLDRPGNIELKLLSIYRNEWAGRHEEKCLIQLSES